MSNHINKITSKGQVTIPADLRKKYNLSKGKKIIFIETEDGILIKPVLSEMRKLRGFLKNKVDLNRMEEDLKELRREWRIDDDSK